MYPHLGRSDSQNDVVRMRRRLLPDRGRAVIYVGFYVQSVRFALVSVDDFYLRGFVVPALSVVRSASGLIIRWPATPARFVLESTSNLGLTTIWDAVTNAVVEAEGVRFITSRDGQPSGFFRLRLNEP